MLSLRRFASLRSKSLARHENSIPYGAAGSIVRAIGGEAVLATGHTFTLLDRRVAMLLGSICLGLFMVDALWLTVSSLNLELSSLSPLLAVLMTLLGLAFVYTVLRPASHVSAMALIFLQVELFGVMSTILSYLIIGLGRPLQDDLLARCDAWLGFDWNAYADLIRGREWSTTIFGCAYSTTFVQIMVMTLIFGLSNRRRELYRLTGTLVVGLLAALLTAIWMPAIGAYLHSGQGQFGFAFFGDPLLALHDGKIREIDFRTVHGVITFPSYHAVICVALILSCWPHRVLRYPVLLLEAIVIVSIPAFGEHYLSDVLAGIDVAFASDWLWCRVMGFAKDSDAAARPTSVKSDIEQNALDASRA